MIVSIFKRNYFMQLVLVILIPLLLWIPAFINPPLTMEHNRLDMPIYTVITYLLPHQSILTTVTAFLICIGEAFLINYILTYYELTKKNSYFPAFVYMLLMSCDYRTMTLTGTLFANLFIILAIFSFLQCYNKAEGLDQIFLSSFLVSLASLFFMPYVAFVLWIWIGLLNFKIYKFRPYLVSILGMLAPYLILTVIYYLEGNNEAIINFLPEHFAVLPDWNIMTQPIQVVYMGYLTILIFPSVFYTLTYRNDQKLSVRKRTSTLVLLFVISILPFLYLLNTPDMSLLFAPVMAYMLTVFIFSLKRHLYSNLFLGILLLLTVVKIVINC